jgi:hypothetical protein
MSKKPIPIAGAIITAILVLLFANPPFVDWIRDPNNVDPSSALGFVLNKLTWPAWLFTPGDHSWNYFLAVTLQALLIIGLVFGILSMLAKGIGSGGVAFVVGWVSVILAGAIAGFVAYFIANGGDSTFAAALGNFTAGGNYGLFVGWIVGIGSMMAKRG